MRQELVEDYSDIEKNVVEFISGVHGTGNDREAFREMLRLSVDFFPFQYGPIVAFAPSRFIGYKNNDLSNHKILVRERIANGTVTTPHISKILKVGRPTTESKFSKLFYEYGNYLEIDFAKKKHKFWNIPILAKSIAFSNSAIDDREDDNLGTEDPARYLSFTYQFPRDPEIRRKVVQRANGRCEHCGELGFLKIDGSHFVEAHHIIFLEKQGPDTLDNVIALCPNHHREAHYGADREALENEFKTKLAKIRGK